MAPFFRPPFFFWLIFALFSFISLPSEGKQAALTEKRAKEKFVEIMEQHATYKELTNELVQRSLKNFLNELDPYKIYFLQGDIEQWLSPSNALLNKIHADYERADFTTFGLIIEKMKEAIGRRRTLEKQIDSSLLSEAVIEKNFPLKELDWCKNEEELTQRLLKIKKLQLQAVNKLSEELKTRALQRIERQQEKFEEELLSEELLPKRNLLLTTVLKAMTHALDSQTAYFTPDEAEQFLIQVQQRLTGIGCQLRDDVNGLTIIKVLDGGPAALGGQLKVKDRIIAVNGDPIVGMDINDAITLIRGPQGTIVHLTLIRENKKGEENVEEKIDVDVVRGEVVFQETRYKASYEPYGDGVIAYLHLYSFYQDADSSSASDLTKALKELQQKQQVKGVILDLRYNTGGLLGQAIEVAGLFITKGIVASTKDNQGSLHHLREMSGTTLWDGPLIVLTNRASASASEIVAQSLQDYGRAIIVGDKETFGKGSFQAFSANALTNIVNPEGEYKVTKGRYYTVSGKSPQLLGVEADIVVPGPLSEAEVGEKYSKYPLEGDHIISHFYDDFSDLPFIERYQARLLYQYNLQSPSTTYSSYIPKLKENALFRIQNNSNYQNFLDVIKKINKEEGEEVEEHFGQGDIQLEEATNIMKDLILLCSK